MTADGQPGYRKPGADTVTPFSKGMEFIAMTSPVGSEMLSINVACVFANYNSDIVSYEADVSTGKLTFKKSCKVTVGIAHAPIGSQSNVVVSYQINNRSVTELITVMGTSDLRMETISVQKGDTFIIYYRCSVNKARHIAVIALHCGR